MTPKISLSFWRGNAAVIVTVLTSMPNMSTFVAGVLHFSSASGIHGLIVKESVPE